ncbi:MAG: SUMF1/EgtB/PvdO family nonheme iron enzyme [Myxococcota bacterium]
MNRRVLLLYISTITSLTTIFFTSCSSVVNSCKYDTDCKGDKVCRDGVCVGLYENLDIIHIIDIESDIKDISINDGEGYDSRDIILNRDEESVDIISIDNLEDIALIDITCPSSCDYEGKRFCKDNGYIECKRLDKEDRCLSEVYTACNPGESCRNGACGIDECTEGDRSCIDTGNFQICERDEFGFLRYSVKNCDIGTFCEKRICCPADMVEADGFCIDKYEAIVSDSPECNGVIYGQSSDNYPQEFPDDVSLPNNPPSIQLFSCSKVGLLPSRFITYNQAKTVCQLSGKRLCTKEEYISACKGGREEYNYPYGTSWQPYCNDNLFGDIKNCGAMSQCVSAIGAFDMSGNAEEWVEEVNGTYSAMGGKVSCGGNIGKKCSMCSTEAVYNANTENNSLGFRCCR